MDELSRFDLRLLLVFEALHDTRNSRGAACRLGVTPSAVSHALGRLRRIFADELFVYDGRRMQPTERAGAILPALSRALTILRQEVMTAVPFDPATARREFRIGTPEFAEMVLAPVVMDAFRSLAPGCALHWVEVPAHREAMEEVDLIISATLDPMLAPDFMQQRLYSHALTGLARRGHPLAGAGGGHAARDYPAAVLVADPDTRRKLFQLMAENAIQPYHHVAVSRPLSFSALLERVDAFAISTRAVADVACRLADLECFDLPFALPVIDFHQFWARARHGDAANIWLRTLLSGLLQNRDPSTDERRFWEFPRRDESRSPPR